MAVRLMRRAGCIVLDTPRPAAVTDSVSYESASAFCWITEAADLILPMIVRRIGGQVINVILRFPLIAGLFAPEKRLSLSDSLFC